MVALVPLIGTKNPILGVLAHGLKGALPSIISKPDLPQPGGKKKLLNDSEQITLGKASSKKALISENFSRGNSSNSQNTEFDQR